MKARILIVEDEEALALLLRYNLEAEGYEVETVARGDEADLRLKEAPPDLADPRLDAAGPVRHRALPPAAGAARDQELADHHADRARRGERAHPRTGDRRRRLRRQAVLGARADRPGAARCCAARRPSASRTCCRSATSIVDREKKRVSRAGRSIDLGPTEYRLLEFLMERPGRVFSREQLLDGVWGSDVYIDERTVDVHVGRLRKALNRGQESDPIRTVRGLGLRARRSVRGGKPPGRRRAPQLRLTGEIDTRSLPAYSRASGNAGRDIALLCRAGSPLSRGRAERLSTAVKADQPRNGRRSRRWFDG